METIDGVPVKKSEYGFSLPMRDGNCLASDSNASNPRFSLPMRDGNAVGSYTTSPYVSFSLPMRDGNLFGLRCLCRTAASFSLPMRDGNRGGHIRGQYSLRILAYL